MEPTFFITYTIGSTQIDTLSLINPYLEDPEVEYLDSLARQAPYSKVQ